MAFLHILVFLTLLGLVFIFRKSRKYDEEWEDSVEIVLYGEEELEYFENDVHDHTLQDHIKNSYNKIRKPFTGDMIDQYFHDMISKCSSSKLKRILLYIKQKDEYVTKLEDREPNIIASVWHRIHVAGNKKNRINLVNAFFDELEDCYCKNKLVCVSGRVARIIQSLELLDHEQVVSIVNKQLLEQEILNKIPVLRDKYLKENNLMEKYLAEDEAVAEKVRQYIRSNIRENDEYLETLLREI